MSTETDQLVIPASESTADDGRVVLPEPSTDLTTDTLRYGEDGEVGEAIGKLLYQVWREIMDAVSADNEGRKRFTQGMVSAMRKAYPQFNWVIIHTSHTKSFDGKEGYDWGYGHGEFERRIGSNIGYDIYYCRSGVISRYGDGGYINWAWIGNVFGTSSDGKIVVFRRP